MNLIDKLIERAVADDAPKGLAITGDDIETLAAHARLTKWPDKTLDEIMQMIIDGQLKMLDLPVRVRGSLC